MLTYLLGLLTPDQSHWLAKKLGVYEGLHEFMPGFCCELIEETSQEQERVG